MPCWCSLCETVTCTLDYIKLRSDLYEILTLITTRRAFSLTFLGFWCERFVHSSIISLIQEVPSLPILMAFLPASSTPSFSSTTLWGWQWTAHSKMTAVIASTVWYFSFPDPFRARYFNSPGLLHAACSSLEKPEPNLGTEYSTLDLVVFTKSCTCIFPYLISCLPDTVWKEAIPVSRSNGWPQLIIQKGHLG